NEAHVAKAAWAFALSKEDFKREVLDGADAIALIMVLSIWSFGLHALGSGSRRKRPCRDCELKRLHPPWRRRALSPLDCRLADQRRRSFLSVRGPVGGIRHSGTRPIEQWA